MKDLTLGILRSAFCDNERPDPRHLPLTLGICPGDGLMFEREAGLIVRVRQGVLSFERLVETLTTEGYLTDADGADGLGFSRVCIDATHQEDFDALWNFFYPGEGHSIVLESCASDKGFAVGGGFTNALFNEALVSRDEMMETLKRLNAKMEREFPSTG
jgi:hypothetical protein